MITAKDAKFPWAFPCRIKNTAFNEIYILKGEDMKIADILVSAIIKKGIFYEARNVDTTVDIPMDHDGKEKIIRIQFKAEHMTIRVDKEGS
jgi:hypothetical protein